MGTSKSPKRRVCVNYFSRWLVKLAYWVDDSKHYNKLKEFFRMFLVYQHSRIKLYFDIFMIILVLGSVYFLIYEVKHKVNIYMEWFEVIAVSIFIFEYLGRLWVYSDNRRIIIEAFERSQFLEAKFPLWGTLYDVVKKKFEYMTTPLAIIDLLAILPSYRPLRILRIFLLFRLFKLFRYARSIHAFAYVLSEKRFELGTLAIFVSFIIATASSAIYIFEANSNPNISDFFDAVYWSLVTVSTVGYGDITPKSTPGMVITMLLIVLGVAVLAFLTSIIVSAFSEKLNELKENRVFAEIEKMREYILICGYGRVGEVVAKMLDDDGERLVIVDIDEEKIELVKSRGMKGICGDASHSKLLQELGVGENVTQVICATDSDVMNIFITLTARSLNKNVKIISRVDKKSNKKKFMLAGADFAFSPHEIVGIMGAEYVQQPMAYEALDGMLTGNKGIEFSPIKVFKHSSYIDTEVGNLDLIGRRLILFGVTRRAGEKIDGIKSYDVEGRMFYFNPPAAFRLQADDILILLGRRYHLEKFEESMDQSTL